MPVTSSYPQSAFVGWLLILAWAPLPLASNRLWALALLILLCSALAIVMLLQTLYRNTPLLQQLKPYRVPILLWLVVPLWSTLQTFQLPLNLLATLSPAAADIYTSIGAEAGSISLDPGRTQIQAAWSWALWLFFIMTLLLLDTRERVHSAAMFIVYCGLFQALYGSFKTLSGIELNPFLASEAYQGVATGTFVNRNHLAGYLELTLSVGVGMLVATLSQGSRSGWRDKMRGLMDTILGPKMRLRIFLALMVIALVLTHSRMGNSAFFSSLLICGLTLMIMQRKLHKGALILFVSLILIDSMIVGQWFGFEEVVQRVQNTTAAGELRDEVVRDTLVLLQDYPLTGSGLGSYASVYPQYQQADVRGFFDHAHNDYLEFAVELGLIGMGPLATLVLLSLYMALKTMYQRRDQLAKGVAFASSMGIIALLIHSAVDFNLQMAANAQLFTVLLALAWIAGTLPRQGSSDRM